MGVTYNFDQDDMLDLLHKVRASLPDEVKRASRVDSGKRTDRGRRARDRRADAGRRPGRAERITREARASAERMVRDAETQAARATQTAEAESKQRLADVAPEGRRHGRPTPSRSPRR